MEAQGRGSLHVHMLLWLRHAPNADEMLELLTHADFCEKIAKYMEFNIQTHLMDLMMSMWSIMNVKGMFPIHDHRILIVIVGGQM